MEFGNMGPTGRAQEALRWCIERGHKTGQLCTVCAAEAIDKTIAGGVELAGRINDQAVKLMDAGDAWKKRAETAELQIKELAAAAHAVVSARGGSVRTQTEFLIDEMKAVLDRHNLMTFAQK